MQMVRLLKWAVHRARMEYPEMPLPSFTAYFAEIQVIMGKSQTFCGIAEEPTHRLTWHAANLIS